MFGINWFCKFSSHHSKRDVVYNQQYFRLRKLKPSYLEFYVKITISYIILNILLFDYKFYCKSLKDFYKLC